MADGGYMVWYAMTLLWKGATCLTRKSLRRLRPTLGPWLVHA